MPDTETLTEERLKEIEAANEEHRIDWRYPNQKDRIRALCRSLRAAWAEHDTALARVVKFNDLSQSHAEQLASARQENAALRTQNQTQAESITYFQENEKKLKAHWADTSEDLASALLKQDELKAQLAQVEQERNEQIRTVEAIGICKNLTCGHCMAIIRATIKGKDTR